MLHDVEMVDGGYSYSEKQLGRLSLKPYLLEMEKVYRECYSVLGGRKMIVVVRNYIRDKRVVDLVYETYKLCSLVGFELVEAIKFRIPKMREELIRYYRDNPYVPRILHEYALVWGS